MTMKSRWYIEKLNNSLANLEYSNSLDAISNQRKFGVCISYILYLKGLSIIFFTKHKWELYLWVFDQACSISIFSSGLISLIH